MFFSTLPDASSYYQGVKPEMQTSIQTPSPETINSISLAGNVILFLLLMSYIVIDVYSKQRQINRYQRIATLERILQSNAQPNPQTETRLRQIQALEKLWRLKGQRKLEQKDKSSP